MISEESSEDASEEFSEDSSEQDASSEEQGYGYNFYGGYYGELTWDDGEDLKNKLNTIIRTGWNKLRYTVPNWETNTYADHTKYDYEYLDVLYSAKDADASLTQKKWQREHAFAASLMTGQGTGDAVKTPGRATDFHNLFAADASANMSRGNKNYGNADTSDATYTDRTVNDGVDGYSFDEVTFEPADKDKGRLARAIFYMDTMYKDDEDGYEGLTIVEENVSYSPGNCQYAIGHLSELLDWSDTYDVDYLEMQHNESVYSHIYSGDGVAQGNRNPYIDYPELVEYVYGDKQSESGDLKDLKPACYDLETNKNEFSHYALLNAKREFTYGNTLTTDDFTVISVNKDFTYTIADPSEYTHNLLDHTFVVGDGGSTTAIITAGEDIISYDITLDPFATCSYHYDNMKKNGIDKTKPNIDHSVTYGDESFTFNFAASGSVTLQDTSAGGFKIGSGTVAVTGITITSVNSYTVDCAYMKCYAANASSSYTLKIYVGDTEVYSGNVTNTSTAVTYGGEFETLTGKVKFVFTGSNAINLNGIAFNKVS